MSRLFSKKRIAILIPGGVGDEHSGMHLPALRTLVEQLAEVHDLHVYSLAPPNWRETSGWCNKAQVSFFPVNHNNGTVRKFWLLATACRRDHQVQPFDVVHGFWAIPSGATAVILGKYLGLPSIVSFLGGETAYLPQIPYGNMTRWSTRMITRWVSERADTLTVLTNHQAAALHHWGSKRDAMVIPFGVDVTTFLSSDKDITIRPLRLLHVANIHALKDQPTLLRAFHIVLQSVDAHLRIIGTDQSGGSMQRLATEMDIVDKVEFLGHISHNKLSEHYRWAQILVHTSMHEAQGAVISEAASSGVLVAGTRTGLVADFGEDKALISDVGDYRTLAKQILDVIGDPKRYDTLRLDAQEWACSHDLSWTVRQYLELYDTVRIQ